MSEFVKKGNKYFRNTSDGKQIEVTFTKDGHFYWVEPNGQRVRTKKKYKIITTPKKKESFLGNIGKGLVNAIIGASVAEAPAVQTANGWYMDDNLDWKQDTERPGAKQLRPILGTIGVTGSLLMTPNAIPAMLIGVGTEKGERALFGKSLGDVTSGFVKNHNPFPVGKDHYLGSFGHLAWDFGSEMLRPEYGLYGLGKSLYTTPYKASNFKNLKQAFLDKNYDEITDNPITKSLLYSPTVEMILTKTPVGKRAIETVMRTSGSDNPIPYLLKGIESLPMRPRINYILFGKNPKLRKLFGESNMHFNDNSWNPDKLPYTGLYEFFEKSPTIRKGYGDIIDAYLYGTTIDPKIATLTSSNAGKQFFNTYILKNYPNKTIKTYTVKGDVDPKDIVETQKWEGSNFLEKSEFKTNDNKNSIDVAGHNIQYGRTDNSSSFNARRGFDIWKFNPDDYNIKWIKDQDYLKTRGLELVDKAGNPIIFEQPWKLK